jgi:hypothetical protein
MRLLPDDLQYILLPGFQGGIGAQEPQEIVLRMGRDALAYYFISHTRARQCEKDHRRAEGSAPFPPPGARA